VVSANSVMLLPMAPFSTRTFGPAAPVFAAASVLGWLTLVPATAVTR